jgi:hypothetical protein
MAIDCRTALERLAEPGGLADREVSAHLSRCADCRGAHRALALVQATREEPSAQALSGFAVRVRAAHLQGKERTRRRAPMRAALLAGALAAAGAASVGLALDSSFQPAKPLAVAAPNTSGSLEPNRSAEGRSSSGPLVKGLDSETTPATPYDLLPDEAALEELASAADSFSALAEDEADPSGLGETTFPL